MPRPADRMSAITSALQDLERAMRALVGDNTLLRKQLQGFVGRAGLLFNGRGRGAGSAAARRRPTERLASEGRAFKFTDEQAAELRKQVEGGKSARCAGEGAEGLAPHHVQHPQARRAGTGASQQGRGRRCRPGCVTGRPAKRGRCLQVHRPDQAGEFRKQVEGGKSAVALARELKVSLPTMYNTLRRAGWKRAQAAARRGRHRPPARGAAYGAARKRGRAFKFTADQAGELPQAGRGPGSSAAALAKELKVSLPTMYNTLKRAGWKARK